MAGQGSFDDWVRRLQAQNVPLAFIRGRVNGRCDSPHHTAEEINGDVWTQAIQKHQEQPFESEDYLRNWLMRTAKCRIVDFFRRQSHRQSSSLEGDVGPPRLATEMLIAKVRDMLDHLPEADRKLIEDKFFGGKTFTKIAAELDLSNAAISKRYRRILEELRRLFLE